MSTFMHSFSILSPFPERTRTLHSPVFHRTQLSHFPIRRHLLRGSLGVTRFGLGQSQFPDPDAAGEVITGLFGRVEGFLYTVADAAVSASPDAVDTATTTKSSDWLSGITDAMEGVLKVLKGGLSAVHVPYAYGFAIILLTVLVKAVTFPLTKKQVESAMAMQSLTPQIKAIQERYAGDQERLQLETARLYKLAGVNPLAGCLPTLVTIPIWIGLYRALSNVANEGLLTEGFFWIPSLAGPTTVAARQTGSGTSWLFPFVDGHPPLGWSDTLAYLVLPILLIVTQYISVEIMQPPQSNDPDVKNSQVITKLLPLAIGYFALSVPSGLSLYWLTNNILSTGQQVWLRKMGGAKNPVRQNIIKEEQPQVMKSISEATAPKKVSQEVKLTSDGPRPGERFKQLKEEEARRRRQREEEKRRKEEMAAKGIQRTTGEVKKEDNGGSSLSVDGFGVNGNTTNSELKDDQNTSADNGENAEVLDERDNRSNRHLYEKLEKE